MRAVSRMRDNDAMTDVPILIAPLDADHWGDLVALFGPERGASGRCWCMWWRVTGRQFDDLGGDGRRDAFAERARLTPPAGLLAYRGGVPVGWIAVAPRTEYGRLDRSPLLKPVDDAPVWSITCFYVDRGHRRTGVTGPLIAAAVELAHAHGAVAVEAYPIDTTAVGGAVDADVFTGTGAMFAAAGFVEVARRRRRPIVRRDLSPAA